MYRFTIEGEEWILRFSPRIAVDAEEKSLIYRSLLDIGSDLSSFSHGHAFMMMNKTVGAIVFEIERIPSLIVTISTIIPVERWYIRD